MRISRRVALKLALALALVAVVLTPPAAHAGPGHDHGEEAAAQANAMPRVVADSDLFELVGILGEGGTLTIYLDRTATNEPVDGAEIEVMLGDAQAKAERIGPAVYRVRLPALAKPGHFDLTFSLTAGTDSDLLAGSFEVPAPPEEGAVRHGWLDALTEAPLLWVGGVGLFVAGLLLGYVARPRTLPPMVETDPIPAPSAAIPPRVGAGEPTPIRRVAAPTAVALLTLLAVSPAWSQPAPAPEPPRRLPDGAVFVPKPTQRLLEVRTQRAELGRADTAIQLVGTIVPDPNASGRVQASQAGRLEPGEGGLPVLGQRVERGQVLAYVTPAYSISERGTLQQSIAELDQQIGIAEARANRLAGLRGSVSDREIQEARQELAGLRQRRAAVAPSLSGREPLIAPVSGVVSTVRGAIGGIVDNQQPVFEIVDPTRLWVEALAFDRTAQGTVSGASVLLPDGRTAPLELVGRGLSVRQGAVPLNFRLPSPPEGISVGTPVTVLLRLPRPQEGIVLPADAVVRSAEGPPVVYAHAAPERFVPLQVRAEPIDGARVLVTAGVEPGTRVVTRAAGMIAQVR
ncbi:efflux RND transporter periplasmic adaptor subunit [Roseicella aquatilis]|uniref:HlyD family efflux transporter periplasmic adaptor subunit n=1 Tax=Roseicella aquatilis TaxID=2527868 RepID=A0A4R4DKA1_9PROT|nr:efflux RND transporter periplasmic adaptor subunit [Roseicella aquatilis]TCZ61165.1 HlyD family efflux transporter periplasmic adaptor subunit [Roseicella aquatilis]